MARAIDAEKYMELLKEQYLHHKSLGNSQAEKAWQGAIQLLYDMTTLTPPNEPLTLEQLREMDGKPVYVVCASNKSFWALVAGRFVECIKGGYYWKADMNTYGTSWRAYSYPPAHIDREAWVSVEDRMPEDENDGETVLVIVFGKPHENITLHGVIMTAGYFRDEGWVLNEYPEWEGPEVTHWMPLPSPPAELEKRLRGVRA